MAGRYLKLFQKALFSALILAGFSGVSSASTVSLVPTSNVIDVVGGDTVSFDIVIDFSDVGGTLGGGLDLTWDPLALQLLDFTDTIILGDPAFGRPPDASNGLLESWGVADFDGLSESAVATLGAVSFQVLPTIGLGTIVALGPTSGIAGPWTSNLGNFEPFTQQPTYNSIAVTSVAPSVVPVPAAAWLFGTGLLGLLAFSKRKLAA